MIFRAAASLPTTSLTSALYSLDCLGVHVATFKHGKKSQLRKLPASGDWSSLPKNTLKAPTKAALPSPNREMRVPIQ